MRHLGIILGMVVAMLMGNTAKATVINVALGTDVDIQNAINGATSGDTIQLASGTYNFSSYVYFFGLDLSVIGNGSSNTILDCNNATYAFYIDFFEAVSIESLSIVDGEGLASDPWGFKTTTDGGGIYAFAPSFLTLKDVVFLNCNSSANGGGLYATSGNITLDRVYFDSNSAAGNGGGFCFMNDAIGTGIACSVTKTSFDSNSSGGYGAALFYDAYYGGSVNLNIINSTIGNQSTGNSAVYLTGTGSTSTISLRNNTIAYNSSGGINIDYTMFNMSFYNNLIIDNSSFDITSSAAVSIGGDRNMFENLTGGVSFGNSDNYYEAYPNAIVESTFAYNNGGIVPTLNLTDYGIKVAAGRAKNYVPTQDQNGIIRRSRSELGAIETNVSINVWTGASGTAWNNAANWTGVNAPAATDVYAIIDNCIGSNYPISTSTIFVPGLKIIVGNYGAFKNTAGMRGVSIFLMSNSTGTGQFINTGTIIMSSFEIEQYLFGNQWNFLGIPVGSIDVSTIIPGATLGTATWSGSAYTYSGGDYWVFYHDQAERAANGHSDLVWKPVNSGSLIGGTGYIVWCDVPQKAIFTGAIVSNNFTHNLAYSTVGDLSDRGWNLISNPYLAPFSWVGTDVTYVDQASYFYSNAFQNYFVIPSDPIDGTTEKIPQVQGFFAKANTTGGSLEMLSSLVSIDKDVTFKTSALSEKHYLRTTIFRDGEKYYDKTYIRHKDDAGLMYEGKYDAYKLKNLSNVSPQIYTEEGNTSLSINSFSYYDYPNQEVPLMISVPEADTYKLAFNIDNSMGDFEYVLEDKQDGSFYNLNDGDTINIELNKLVEKSRLIVHVVGNSTAVGEVQKDEVLIYANNGNLYINTSDRYAVGNVRMYDLAGKILLDESITDNNTIIRVSDLPSQFVIVNYESMDKRFTKRLNLR
ncbi:hypothetical protein [Saccharicrinis sp. FJH54]|uniref:hypothetical protein n=1 Tax=Saccharicrinis sp. FJH54 TaxID=3344665 RepID=UPI0035D41D1B